MKDNKLDVGDELYRESGSCAWIYHSKVIRLTNKLAVCENGDRFEIDCYGNGIVNIYPRPKSPWNITFRLKSNFVLNEIKRRGLLEIMSTSSFSRLTLSQLERVVEIIKEVKK